MGSSHIKTPRYKLSPSLCDGEHWTVADTPSQVLEAVKAWAEDVEYSGGPDEHDDGFAVEVVMMSDAEMKALPDI